MGTISADRIAAIKAKIWINAEEAALYLDRSQEAVRMLRRNKKLGKEGSGHVKKFGGWYYNRPWIDRYFLGDEHSAGEQIKSQSA